MLWGIPKPLAPMVRVLSVHLAQNGTVAAQPPKIALNWAMIKIAPEPEKAVAVKPVMANIKLALAHLPTLGAVALALAQALINTPAPAPATPAAPALPATASTPPASVPQATNGKIALAK